MIRTFIAFVLVVLLGSIASAQQGRAKLDAPGKVAFGTTYENAAKLLGPDAEPYEQDPPQPGIKVLSCDKCSLLPNVEGLTLHFQNNGGLVRVEAFAVAGMFKTVDECQKGDSDMMPKLVTLYGKPDSNEISKKSGTTSKIASFRFGDGGVVQHTSSTTKSDRPCTYTVSYMSKALGSR
ncbi:hypothetical protein [Bradyrhizobium sp. MOS003]|uniref:hypothetical protein n=1 Tax=Bradyrhizobium sp. MOS003 TaxID=2133946 RepID=UPI000D12D871|nr:hypothetical protein [Bradyrhizobium sp. MOS003]PSO19489.1 hypothetical protein C7G42_14625 [Bradyrhizobium sp. MOS003]